MNRTIRIGTRDSQLAMWQANRVKSLLSEQGIDAVLVPIKSEGDINLTQPIYEIGVQGVFTKALDIALLNQDIDLAIHSYKDVPTKLAKELTIAAVLKRGSCEDILLIKENSRFLNDKNSFAQIATSSIRRKAQWLNRYPNHGLHTIRGNVNTRLKKFETGNWDGIIFAKAGLERLGLLPANAIALDWMLPAPAQGAIVVVRRKNDSYLHEACAKMNDKATALCTAIERDFLRRLMGGCSTPVSAYAYIESDNVIFKGAIHSLDGKQEAHIEKSVPVADAAGIGEQAADELLAGSAEAIMKAISLHAKS